VHTVEEGQPLFLRDICYADIRGVHIYCARISNIDKVISDYNVKYAPALLKLENTIVVMLHEESRSSCRYSVRGEVIEIYECNKPVVIRICSGKNESKCYYVALRNKVYKSLDWWIQTKNPQSF
jgi:ribosomal protein S24E